MSKIDLENEVGKISLDDNQIQTVNNHFNDIKEILNDLGFSVVDKQGSFGRSTVIKGQESDGFDLDIVFVVPETGLWDYVKNKERVCDALRRNSRYKDFKIDVNEKAITIDVRQRFNIDVTQIVVDQSGTEFVFNNNNFDLERSASLKFVRQFRKINSQESTGNSLRDLARIYKHVRDAANDFNVPSLVIEILLMNNFKGSHNYAQEMLDDLKSVEINLNGMKMSGTYEHIKNPCDGQDLIKTKLYSSTDIDNLIILNKLVYQIIKDCIVSGKTFRGLQRKYISLKDLSSQYSVSSYTTLSSIGVYGGYKNN